MRIGAVFNSSWGHLRANLGHLGLVLDAQNPSQDEVQHSSVLGTIFGGVWGRKNLQKPKENLDFFNQKKPVSSKEREAR